MHALNLKLCQVAKAISGLFFCILFNPFLVSHDLSFAVFCLCFYVAYIANNMEFIDPDQTVWEQSDQGSYCLLS